MSHGGMSNILKIKWFRRAESSLQNELSLMFFFDFCLKKNVSKNTLNKLRSLEKSKTFNTFEIECD